MGKLSRSTTEKNNRLPDHESTTSTPRWVKLSGIIIIIVIMIAIFIMVISGGNHGPGRHMPSSIGIEQGVFNS
ncbi:hypothetical protein QGM71_17775 [Virgibacillus sp. C22-A2]|uniref:Uncharacterized protein n=1 Tax=Virgibacillus tibetensis TaxID=3042313 RepID=A0ABU6KKD5_9BACI|nr:hypothetical protein [Virgibacillus sp. C22-A2]